MSLAVPLDHLVTDIGRVTERLFAAGFAVGADATATVAIAHAVVRAGAVAGVCGNRLFRLGDLTFWRYNVMVLR